MARPADVLAAVTKLNRQLQQTEKLRRITAEQQKHLAPIARQMQNAKAWALMAEALEQHRSEPPPFVTRPAERVVYVRVMVCRQGMRRHVTSCRRRRGR